MKRLLFLVPVLLALPALAQPPVVTVSSEPDEVPVGEPVRIQLTVLCPTWFAKPPQFPPGELANTITLVPERGSSPTTRTIDGESWSGVVYNYEVYPLQAASYRLSGETVAVTCAVPGSIQGEARDVVIDDVEFRALVPEGAGALDPYLSGSYLTLERQIEGEPEALEVGDALTVTYTAELDGLPAIFLPPLVAIADTPGVSVYADQPVVDDEQPARRTERYTFVFEAGGEFVVPGAGLDWWNRDAGRIETASVEPTKVSVVGDPLPEPEVEAPPPEPIDWSRVLAVLAALVLLWRLFSWLWPKVEAALAARRERRLASEEYAFDQLRRALLGTDRRKAQATLLQWLERIAPGLDLGAFAERFGDDKLRNELLTASRSLYRDGGEDVHLKRLWLPLSKARGRALEERRHRAEEILPPLNP